MDAKSFLLVTRDQALVDAVRAAVHKAGLTIPPQSDQPIDGDLTAGVCARWHSVPVVLLGADRVADVHAAGMSSPASGSLAVLAMDDVPGGLWNLAHGVGADFHAYLKDPANVRWLGEGLTPTPADRMDKFVALLAEARDTMDRDAERLLPLFERAEETCDYSYADEKSADVNEAHSAMLGLILDAAVTAGLLPARKED